MTVVVGLNESHQGDIKQNACIRAESHIYTSVKTKIKLCLSTIILYASRKEFKKIEVQ